MPSYKRTGLTLSCVASDAKDFRVFKFRLPDRVHFWHIEIVSRLILGRLNNIKELANWIQTTFGCGLKCESRCSTASNPR